MRWHHADKKEDGTAEKNVCRKEREKTVDKKNLFQIGEVAEMFHLSVSSLRHYERCGLLRPEYIDPDSGDRYYSARQLEVLTTIRFLRQLDMPIAQIRDFLGCREIGKIQKMLREQEEDVRRRQRELAQIERKIHAQQAVIEDALRGEMETITLRHLPKRRAAWIRGRISPKHYFDLETSIRELEKEQPGGGVWLGKIGIGIRQENLETGNFLEYGMVFLLLDEQEAYLGHTETWPEMDCLCLRFHGSHRDAPPYYEKMLAYARENGFAVNGFSREITLIDEGMTRNPEEFVTEIQVPVRCGVSAR